MREDGFLLFVSHVPCFIPDLLLPLPVVFFFWDTCTWPLIRFVSCSVYHSSFQIHCCRDSPDFVLQYLPARPSVRNAMSFRVFFGRSAAMASVVNTCAVAFSPAREK